MSDTAEQIKQDLATAEGIAEMAELIEYRIDSVPGAYTISTAANLSEVKDGVVKVTLEVEVWVG